MLHDLLHMGVPPGEKVVRTLAVYLALLLLLRLAGKRQLAQLTTFDFVVMLLLSNVVQNAVIGNDNSLLGGLLGAAVLVLGNWLIVFFAFLNPRLDADLRGREVVLVRDGKLEKRALRRELLSPAELRAALGRQGYHDLSHVREATLQPDGALVVSVDDAVSLRDVMAALERIERRLR